MANPTYDDARRFLLFNLLQLLVTIAFSWARKLDELESLDTSPSLSDTISGQTSPCESENGPQEDWGCACGEKWYQRDKGRSCETSCQTEDYATKLRIRHVLVQHSVSRVSVAYTDRNATSGGRPTTP